MRMRLLAVSATVSLVAGMSACSSDKVISATPSGTVIPVAKRVTAGTFKSETLEGRSFDSSHLPKGIVVLDFWASWCGPCTVELPQLDLVAQSEAAHGVAFLGISTKDTRARAKTFVANHQIRIPSLFDEQGRVGRALASLPDAALPYTVILDPERRIAAVYVGPVTAVDLQDALAKLDVGTPTSSAPDQMMSRRRKPTNATVAKATVTAMSQASPAQSGEDAVTFGT